MNKVIVNPDNREMTQLAAQNTRENLFPNQSDA
jgi:hypothetical protein